MSEPQDLICYSPIADLGTSDMIVVCADGSDSERCADLIKKLRQESKRSSKEGKLPPVGVVSIQKGVRNSSVLVTL